ncbi:DUF2919 family protein [Rhodoferax saidenbachensis]|uniref:DUF2919 domain-containing protein n=1 Tax=Rhodoferax saidenbachensis TaxID=1484693 RepID=A0A1P8KET3_9BURK|nr:DUF2919 family protein [Rhodoferax saidenbachensis]APW44476.1 hypothetical protein RS694_19435 [Rhodoferax saidenbachensis]
MSELDERYLEIDQHGILKIPPSLWFSLFFLARFWGFLLTSIMSPEILGRGGFLLTNAGFWIVLICELPVVILIYAGFSRHPNGGRLARFIWPLGRIIIALTAAANLYFLVWWLLHSDYWERWPELFLVSCGVLDLTAVFATWGSDYLKQVFNEFPPKE